jgi:environmental stress-induced protein Ves
LPNPDLNVVRRASFIATPWKNGGGITHEAIRVPAAGGAFRWRLSVAHIDASGPFSDFAGYLRTMVLLQGAGVKLRFGDGSMQTLRRVGDCVQFDGALPAFCELLDGPCVDLNLMVSMADRVDARIERLNAPLSVGAADEETLLLVPIEEGVSLEVGSGAAGDAVTLETCDAAVLSHGTARLSPLERSRPHAPAVFLASLKLVGGK